MGRVPSGGATENSVFNKGHLDIALAAGMDHALEAIKNARAQNRRICSPVKEWLEKMAARHPDAAKIYNEVYGRTQATVTIKETATTGATSPRCHRYGTVENILLP